MAFADRGGDDRHDQPGPGADPPRRATARLPVPGLDRRLRLDRHDPCAPSCRAQSTRRAGCWSTPTTGWSAPDYPYLLTRRLGAALAGRSGSKRCWATRGALDAERFAAIQLDVDLAAWQRLPALPARRRSAWPGARAELLGGAAAWDRRDARGPARAARCSPPGTASSADAIYADELGAAVRRPSAAAPGLPASRAARAARSGATTSATPAGRDLRRAGRAGVRSRAGRARARATAPDWRPGAGATRTRRCWRTARSSTSRCSRDWFSRAGPGRRRRHDGQRGAIPGAPATEIPFGAVHAAGYRAIYDLADPDRSRWIAATGQSGHPLSPPLSRPGRGCGRTAAICHDARGRYQTRRGRLGTLRLQPAARP